MTVLALDLADPDGALVAGVRHVIEAGHRDDRGDWGIVRDVAAFLRVRGAEPSEFGIARAERAAGAVRAELRQKRIDKAAAEPPAVVAERERLSGLEEEVARQEHVEKTRAAAGLPPQLLTWADFSDGADEPLPAWLVKHMLPETGLALIYGESQAGKSFLAVWIALSVAWGLPLFGKRVKQGGVLYVAAEGGKSVHRRLRVADAKLRDGLPAAKMTGQVAASVSRAPVRVVHQAPNLSREGDPDALVKTGRQAAVDFAREGSRLALVIVDTWHASLGGADENSAADAGHALRPLKQIAEETGALVIAVHHPGKDADKGARGSNSLVAAVDTSIALRVPSCPGAQAKPSSALREATIMKQRDGETADQFHFKLLVAEIGRDEDGDPVTTCVVEPADSPRVGADGLAERDRTLLDCLAVAINEAGGTKGRLDVARKAFINRLVGDGAKPAGAKADWYRRLKALREAGRIECDDHDEWAWIPAAQAGDTK